MNRGRRIALALTVVGVVVGTTLIGRAVQPDPSTAGVRLADAADVSSFDYEFDIPPGTADQIAAGADVEIVPRTLVVRVGEAIRIVNDDSEGHVVGVFFIGAGETLTQRFIAPGELSGACSVHPSGQFRLRVEA